MPPVADREESARLDRIAILVAGMHAASWRDAYRGVFPDTYLDGEIDAERLRHWRRRVPELAAGEGELFLATLDHQAAGFLCIDIGPEIEWGAYVDNLHVLPPWRGTRIGASLLARAEQWSLRRGERQLYLWVFEQNHAARRFYQRGGWREAERQYHQIPGGDTRAVWRLIKRP